MRKIIATLTFIPMILSAETIIEDTLSITKELQPDKLKKNISIALKADSNEEITKKFESLLEKASSYKDVCKGGAYSSSPTYSYKDGKTVFEGYSGSMSFECAFSRSENFQPFFNHVISELPQEFRVSIGESRWVLSDKNRDQATSTLKIAVLKSAMQLAENYEKELDFKRCTVLNVNISESTNEQPYTPVFRSLAMKSNAMDSSPIELQDPIKNEVSISVFANIKLECR